MKSSLIRETGQTNSACFRCSNRSGLKPRQPLGALFLTAARCSRGDYFVYRAVNSSTPVLRDDIVLTATVCCRVIAKEFARLSFSRNFAEMLTLDLSASFASMRFISCLQKTAEFFRPVDPLKKERRHFFWTKQNVPLQPGLIENASRPIIRLQKEIEVCPFALPISDATVDLCDVKSSTRATKREVSSPT